MFYIFNYNNQIDGIKQATKNAEHPSKKSKISENGKTSSTSTSNSSNETPITKYLSGIFRMNTKSGGSSGGGTPFDGSDKEKRIFIGVICAAGLIGSMLFFDVNSKEITWREFAYR